MKIILLEITSQRAYNLPMLFTLVPIARTVALEGNKFEFDQLNLLCQFSIVALCECSFTYKVHYYHIEGTCSKEYM